MKCKACIGIINYNILILVHISFYHNPSLDPSNEKKLKDFGGILDFYVSNDYKHDLEFMQHCQAFYPIDKD
jgi:hypothetical protein